MEFIDFAKTYFKDKGFKPTKYQQEFIDNLNKENHREIKIFSGGRKWGMKTVQQSYYEYIQHGKSLFNQDVFIMKTFNKEQKAKLSNQDNI